MMVFIGTHTLIIVILLYTFLLGIIPRIVGTQAVAGDCHSAGVTLRGIGIGVTTMHIGITHIIR